MAVVRQHHDQLMKEMLASVKGRWAMPDEAPPTTTTTPASSFRPAESQQKLYKKSVSDCYQPTQPPVTVRSEASEWRRTQPTSRSRESGTDVTSSADSAFPTQLRSASVEKQHSYSEESSSPQRVGLAAVQKPAAASEVLQPQLKVTSAVAVRLGPRPYAPPGDSFAQSQSEVRSQAVFSPTAAWTGQSYPGFSAGASTTSSRRQPPSGRSQDDSSIFTAVRVLTSPVGRMLNAESLLERRSAAVEATDQPQLSSSNVDRYSQDSRRTQSVRRPQDDSGLPKMATNGRQSPLSPSFSLFRGDRLTNNERPTASSSSPRTFASASFSMPPQPSPKEAGTVAAKANGDHWSSSSNTFNESRFSSIRRTTSSSSTTSPPATTTGPGPAAAATSFSPSPSDRSPMRGRDPLSGASFGGSATAAQWSTGSSASTGSGADSSGWLWSPSPSKELSSSSPKSLKNLNGGSGSNGSSAMARNTPLNRGFSSDSAPSAGFSSGQASHLARDRSRSMLNQCTVTSSSVAPFSHSVEQPFARSASCQPPGNGYSPGSGGKYTAEGSKRSASLSSSSLANQLQRQLCLDINDVPLDADDRVSVSELIQEFNGFSPPPPQTPSAYATQQGTTAADILFSPRASSAASSPRILQHSSRSKSTEGADSPAGPSKGSAVAASRHQPFGSPPLTATPSTSVAPRERNTLTYAGSKELNGYAKNGAIADVTEPRDRARQFSFDVVGKANGGAPRLKTAYSQDDGLVLSKRGGSLSPKLKLDFANDPKILGYCAVCDEAISAIVGGCVSMGKKYHVSCLVCCQCGKELAEQTFYTIEGKPHCRHCFSSTLEKCSACDEVITGKLLRAAGSVYHLSCFVCAICKCFLEGKQFVLGEDKRPLCVDDYYENFAPKCYGCRKPIIPEDGQESALQVRVFNRCFHVACCKCEICGKAILTQTSQEAACYPLDGRIVCKACGMSRVYTSTGALP